MSIINEIKPPLWATRFLRFYCRTELAEDLEGDLNECFQHNIKTKGVKWAKLIYIIDVLTFVRSYTLRKPILFNQNLHLMLLKNYSITALRSYKKTKLNTSLNILSLVLGISCFILISLFVLNEFSYNHHFDKSDRIGRISISLSEKTTVETVDLVWSNVQLREELISSYDEVEATTGVLKLTSKIIVRKNGPIFFEEDFYHADPSYFTVFSHKWITGDETTALERPGCIVITQTLVHKYFASENPLGNILNINDRDYEVTGVIENVPLNTDLRFNALLSLDMDFTDWCQTYVLFTNAEALKGFRRQLDSHFDEYLGPSLDQRGSDGSYHLERLRDLHFGNVKLFDSPKGNKTVLISFLSIALIILLVACINYINISIAQSIKRQSEIGIRKVFGALQRQIRIQYIVEAFWITAISFVIAIAVVAYVIPILGEYRIINVSLTEWISLRSLSYMIILIILVSILSGIYPAFILVRAGIVRNLRGNSMINTKNLFHNSMILIHFTISISLIFATLIVNKQIKLLLESDPGYNKDQVIVVDIPPVNNLLALLPALNNELKQLTSVSSASFVTHYSIPTTETWFDVYRIEENFKWLNFIRIDENYFDVLGLKIKDGRIFGSNESSVVVVNEALVKYLGWEVPLGKIISGSEVIGVIQDFNFHGLNQEVEPIQFQPIYRYSDQPEKLLIRLNNSNAGNIRNIKNTWSELMTGYPFEFRFLDAYYQEQFEKEATLNTLLWYVSLLAIVIACVGLFGIISIKIEQKNKDTGIRKIFGARILHLLFITWKEYGAIIAASVLLAYPITALVINKWLQTFSNKTTIDLISLSKAVAIVIGLVLFIIIYQTIKIVRLNPLKSIRYE